MFFFVTQFNRLFDTMSRLHGEPELSIIEPVANWTLDEGVEYDAHQDQFVDEAGDVVTVDWTEQPAEDVLYVPAPRETNVTLAIPGVVQTTSERGVILKWSSDTAERIAAAWGVAIDGELFRVREYLLVPEANPSEIRVTLAEA